MVLAQVVVPLAAIVGLVFAGWFAGDVLSNPRSDDPGGTLATARRLVGEQVTRILLVVGMATIVALPVMGSVLWLARDDAEPVAYVAGALAAGLATAFVAIVAWPAVAGQVTLRAVPATERGAAITLGMLLWGGAAPVMVMALLAAAIPAGLFAAYTNLLGEPAGTAALHIAGFPLGVVVGLGVAAAGAGRFAGVVEEAHGAGESLELAGGSLRGVAQTSALLLVVAAATASGISAGGAVYITTGAAEWAALPPTIVALGVLGSVVGFVSLAAWVRLVRRPNVAVLAGGTVAGVLALMLAAGAVPVLVDDGEAWIAGASVTGVAGGWLLFAVLPGGNPWSPALSVAIGAVVLGTGAGLGAYASIDGVHGSLSGLLGVAVAAAGFVAAWPYAGMLAGLGGGAQAVASLGRDADPFDVESLAARQQLASMAKSADGRSGAYLLAGAVVTAVLGLGVLLVAARDTVATLAASDRERYVEAVQAMRLVPHGQEFASAAVVEVGRFAEALDGAGFTEAELGWLVAANDDQARAFARVRRDDPELDGGVVARLSGSPVPLPHLPSLNLARAPGLAGVVLGLVGAAAVGATLTGRRPSREGEDVAGRAGRAGLAAAALWAVVVLAGAAGAGLLARYLGDTAAGWEAAAGFAAGLAAMALGAAVVTRGSAAQPALVAIAVAAPLSAIVLMPAFVV